VKAKPPATRRRTSKRTELRRASAQAARRLAKEAEEREWRVFLTARFHRLEGDDSASRKGRCTSLSRASRIVAANLWHC